MARVGIFVGGRGTRMGGVAKGLLRVHGELLVDRWLRLAVGHEVVLVGEHPAYVEWAAARGLPILADVETGLGPLAGLAGLLQDARDAEVVAVACDMPYVSEALWRRLVGAPAAAVVAARRGALWEPFFARYDAALVLPRVQALLAGPRRALQPLFDGATELPLDDAEREQLRDWDTEADVANG